MIRYIVCLLFLLLQSTAVFSAVSVDAVSTDNSNSNPSSLSISHTTGSGTNRLMLVGVSLWNDDYESVTSVTYGGVALARIDEVHNNDDSRVEIWELVAPATGTANVVVTFDQSVNRGVGVGISTFTGVDQIAPTDGFVSNTGDSSTASLDVTSASGDLAFAVLAAKNQDATPVASSGVTERWNFKHPGNNRLVGAGATDDGAASVTFSWSLDEDQRWAVAGLSINPSSGDSGSGGSCVTLRDEFSSESYSRNDGTANWAASWDEVYDNDNASNGDIEISGDVLQLEGDGSSSGSLGGQYIQREADLSAYTSATLTFDYSESGQWEGDDDIDIVVSADGGSNWTTIHTFSNDQGGSWQQFSADISAYISGNTRIAFVEKADSADEIFYIDNVEIEACSAGSSLTLLGDWHFDETSWGTVLDSSGNANNGSANNGALTANTDPAIAGSPGTCRYGEFDGSDDYLAFPGMPNLTGDFTIAAWIKPDEIGGDQRIFADDANNSSGFAFSLGDGDNGMLRFFSRGVSPVILDSAALISAGSWQHVAVTHDAASKSRKIYVGGVLVAQDTYTGTWGTDIGDASVGGELDGTGEATSHWRFDGAIDEVQVYDAALSASELANVMSQTHACGTDPIVYFELDEFSLNETSGEISDNMGTATAAKVEGVANGVAPNSDGKVCYGVDIPDNNDSSVYAINTGLDVDADIGNQGSIDFWYRANDAWVGGGDRVLFDASTASNGSKFFYLVLKNNGKLRFGIEDANDNDMIMETTAQSIAAETWTHIAITWDTTTRTYTAYVNAVATSLTMIEQQTSNQTINIANLGILYFGDSASSYHYGGSDGSGDGRFDEIRIFGSVISAVQVSLDMNASHTCDTPPASGAPAFAFNCVYSGLDAVTGRLYTRVAGSAFNFDVVALQDADSNGVADGVEGNYAQDSDRTVTVELVDTSGGQACASRPALSPAVSQSLTFTAADAGRKASANMTVTKAYRSVGCRVTDAVDSPAVVGCSTDSFAIRPTAFTLVTPALNNAGSSGTPIAKAGDAFTLSVDTVAGYDGTPLLAATPLEAHAGGVDGTLNGSFAAADATTGTASGINFTYSEVGNFRFISDAIYDSSFTSVDQNSDCIDGSYSNSLVGGKVGCDFSNSSVTAWIGRFTPDHFNVSINDHGALANSCSGFSYAGSDIGFASDPLLTITAQNSSNLTTVNYQDSYAKLQLTDISMPAISGDAGTNGVDGVTPVGLSWTTGSPSLISNNDGTFSFTLTGDTFNYSRGSNDLVAPFTADVALLVNSVIDSDSVAANNTPQTISPTGVEIRHGRLNVLNAYGSELQTLPMTMRVEYYNGSASGYVPNTADSCTAVTNVALTDVDASDSLTPDETCIWDSAANSGAFACATPAAPADEYSSTPLAAGFNLNLMAPGSGNTGVINVTADAPAWLEFDWLGAGLADPAATATFGIHNRDSQMIYLKEIR